MRTRVLNKNITEFNYVDPANVEGFYYGGGLMVFTRNGKKYMTDNIVVADTPRVRFIYEYDPVAVVIVNGNPCEHDLVQEYTDYITTKTPVGFYMEGPGIDPTGIMDEFFW